jgi:hypothetical protein
VILDPNPESLNRHDAIGCSNQKALSANTFSHAIADFLPTFEATLASSGMHGQVLLERRDAGH